MLRDRLLPSAWHRFLCSKIVDHVEDAPEQVTRQGDLGHVEGGVAGMRDHFRIDLHHLIADGGKRPVFHLLREGRPRQEVERLSDRARSAVRMALAYIVTQDSHVHFTAFLPYSIRCTTGPLRAMMLSAIN